MTRGFRLKTRHRLETWTLEPYTQYMPGYEVAEIYFIAAMMILILIVSFAAVYFFFKTYKKEMREKRERYERSRNETKNR